MISTCFGGAIVLHMARQGFNLKGVASFHGSLGTKQPTLAGKVTAKVLVLNLTRQILFSYSFLRSLLINRSRVSGGRLVSSLNFMVKRSMILLGGTF